MRFHLSSRMAPMSPETGGTGGAQHTVVAGLGATGLSCVRHLRRTGERVVVTDSREAPPGLDRLREDFPDVRVATGGLSVALLEAASRVVASPGIADSEPFLVAARDRGLEVLSDIELFARQATAPVVAITGSNGKSTVTTMVAAMARRAGLDARAGGNLGPPALDLLKTQGAALYVLELSSFQLERTWSLRPVAATVLNLSADHIDRHGSLAAYAAAKSRIYRRCDHAIVNRDDERAAALAQGAQRTIGFGVEAAGHDDFRLLAQDDGAWLARGDTPLMRADALRVAGRHNIANALAALALGSAAGLADADMVAALADYDGLPHRSRLISTAGGLRWIDDSKGTNVGATVEAVRGIDGPLVLIAGGQAKGADFAPLAEALAGRARGAVLIGRDAPALERALEGVCPVRRALDMDEAVSVAAQLAGKGDTVLLSPACASFDMYRDFVARGKAFASSVERWAK